MRNNVLYFFLLCILYYLLFILSRYYLYTDDLLLSFLVEKFPNKSVEQIDNEIKETKWIYFFAIPLSIFIKCNFVILCFTIGAILYNYKINYTKYFQVVLTAEYVYLLPLFFKVTWFVFFEVDFTYTDLKEFTTFSVIDFLVTEELEIWMQYPLRYLNIFELIYMLVLSLLLAKFFGITYVKGLIFMFLTYFLGMLIWLLFVVFLLLSFT